MIRLFHAFLQNHSTDPHVYYLHLLFLFQIKNRLYGIKDKDFPNFVTVNSPGDVSKCKIGQCMYVLLTEKDGGIVNDPVLLKLSKNHFWLSIADSDVLLWCLGMASSNKFDIKLCEPDVSPLALQGPKAPEVMSKIVGTWVKELSFFLF